MKERALFAVLVLLHLVPIWGVDYLPTFDGPCHTYNAWLLHQHMVGEPVFGRYYLLNPRPSPNWFGHAVMALLMFVVEPRVAEKILVSGYVVLLPVAARYLAGSVDPDRRWLSFLAFPLVYNQLFQYGFYNFSFSVVFYLFAVGTWWRRRASPDLGFAVRINLLLLLCWFSHIVSLALALFSIGVLWLATLRAAPWKRHLAHVLILAPQVVLPLWFLAAQGGGMARARWETGTLWGYLLRLEVLSFFGGPQLWIGRILAVVFLVLLIATAAGRLRREDGRPGLAVRQEDGFLLLALLLVVLYFVSPVGGVGGGLLKERLSLYPWLVLLPWLAPRLPERFPAQAGRSARAVAVGALTALALASAGTVLWRYREVNPALQAYLKGAEPIPPHRRVLPLLFDRGPFGLFRHLIGYAAIEKGLLEWNNYSAGTKHFPIRFRHGRRLYWWIEARPRELDVRSPALKRHVDYVYSWGLRPAIEQVQARRLRRHYVLVHEDGPARVYALRRREPGRPGRSRGPS